MQAPGSVDGVGVHSLTTATAMGTYGQGSANRPPDEEGLPGLLSCPGGWAASGGCSPAPGRRSSAPAQTLALSSRPAGAAAPAPEEGGSGLPPPQRIRNPGYTRPDSPGIRRHLLVAGQSSPAPLAPPPAWQAPLQDRCAGRQDRPLGPQCLQAGPTAGISRAQVPCTYVPSGPSPHVTGPPAGIGHRGSLSPNPPGR